MPSNSGAGGSLASVSAATLLCSLKIESVSEGASTNAPITVAGIKPKDILVGVFSMSDAGTDSVQPIGITNRTSVTTIAAKDKIVIRTDTTQEALLVIWWSFPLRT